MFIAKKATENDDFEIKVVLISCETDFLDSNRQVRTLVSKPYDLLLA